MRDANETSICAAVREQYILPDQYILSESINMYRANNTSKSMHIAVQYIAMLCVFIQIDPINIFEDPCAIIGYSIRCPIVGAMHVDCDNISPVPLVTVWPIALDNTYQAILFKKLSFGGWPPL